MRINPPTTVKSGTQGVVLVQEVDFETSQSIVLAFVQRNVNFIINAIRLVSRLITSVSNGATVVVKEVNPNTWTAATLSTALTGANNDLDFTAVTAGQNGNLITVAYVDPGTASAALSVGVVENAITFNLATDAGTAQVETAAVVAAGGATSAGNLPVTITAAGLTGSPLTIQVALDDTVHTSATLIAGAIRTALEANVAVAAFFTIGGSTSNVALTKAAVGANDATLNIAWTTTLGVTAVVTSTNTTAGAAPAITTTGDLLKTALLASAAASALVTAADKSANDGSGVVTSLTATALSGGVNYTVGDTLVASTDLADSDAVGRIQDLSLSATKGMIEGGNSLLVTITAGTCTVDVKDIVVEYTVA